MLRSPDVRERLPRLDALKGVATIAVVAIHALSTGVVGLDRSGVAVAGGLLTSSVPVFIATAVFLAAVEYADVGWRAISRRLPRLAVPYAFATALFVALALAVGGRERAALDHQPLWSVVLFGASWYHLYFLPALAQVLLVLPVLVWIARSRARRWALGACGLIAASGPFAAGTLGDALDHRFLLVWVGPALAAAVCAVGGARVRRPVAWVVGGSVVLAAEALVAIHHASAPAAAYARLGVLLVALGALALGTTKGPAPRWLVALGRRSLGVYLLHPVALLALALARHHAPYPLGAVPLVTAGATAAAWAMTAALARSPAAPVVGTWPRRREGRGPSTVEHSTMPVAIEAGR